MEKGICSPREKKVKTRINLCEIQRVLMMNWERLFNGRRSILFQKGDSVLDEKIPYRPRPVDRGVRFFCAEYFTRANRDAREHRERVADEGRENTKVEKNQKTDPKEHPKTQTEKLIFTGRI